MMCNNTTEAPAGLEKSVIGILGQTPTTEQASESKQPPPFQPCCHHSPPISYFQRHNRANSTVGNNSASSGGRQENENKAKEIPSTPKRKQPVGDSEVVREIVVVRRRVIRWTVTFEFDGEPNKRQKFEEVEVVEEGESD
ncbi:hypothetical protein FRC07_008663, partial [Ceratobasidium sp. 392]